MKLDWRPFNLPLIAPFRISKGIFHERRAIVVKLQYDGQQGLGEATEITYYGKSIEAMLRELENIGKQINDWEFEHPKLFYERLSSKSKTDPFILSALDCAAYDLYGKLHHQNTREILEIQHDQLGPPTSITIGLGSEEEMVGSMIERPWPAYKVKLGQPDDIELMKALRRHTDSVLRVDANGGWSIDECLEKIYALENLNVELIEQPMAPEQDGHLAKIKSMVDTPLVADESCQGPGDVQSCQASYHGINIKLMKCGGITPAIQMISEARDLGLQVMLGCMTESSVGISAAAQLIPLVDFVDLDGAMMLKSDIANGVTFQDGHIKYTDLPGHGCDLKEQFQF